MTVSRSITRTMGAFSVAGVLLLGGCVSDLGANDYSRSTIGEVSHADSGVVIASRVIKIEGSKSGAGAIGGAGLGAVIGKEAGSRGRNSAIGAVGGAIIGGLLGAAIENNATERSGFAYTIKLDRDGEIITITQGGDVAISNGTPVWVEYGERTRVLPKQPAPQAYN
jgi:outer membrane lipoprotein SlyB